MKMHLGTRALTTLTRLLFLPLLLTFLVAGCQTSSGPEDVPTQEIGVVVNSVDRSLTVFRVDDPTVRSVVGVGPDGSPVTLALRGETAVVPLGTVPAAAVVDLRTSSVTRTVALPEGSGATGAAFVNDSVAIVANSNLNTVSPINVRTGQRGAEIAVGRFPQAVIAAGDTVYVLNAELGPDFQPAGPGTVSVIAGSPLRVVKTITLGGTNPGGAALGPGGRIYVVNSGRFGRSEGSLSVIDRASLTEVAHHTGFGSFPGSVAVDPANRAYVGGFGVGLLVWDALTATFIRGVANPVAPGGVTSVSGLGVDEAGRVYALEPECQGPSVAFRLTSAYAVESEIAVGTCPFAIAFTRIPEGGA